MPLNGTDPKQQADKEEPLNAEPTKSTKTELTVGAVSTHKPWQFKPGQSGNPKGRPKGARAKLSEKLLDIFGKDFAKHGRAVIEQVRTERPGDYLKVAASLIPKQVEAEVTVGLSHEDRVTQREKLIAEYEANQGPVIEHEPAPVLKAVN
jgi:hypothetical protein